MPISSLKLTLSSGVAERSEGNGALPISDTGHLFPARGVDIDSFYTRQADGLKYVSDSLFS
jgi:hypothetical protein